MLIRDAAIKRACRGIVYITIRITLLFDGLVLHGYDFNKKNKKSNKIYNSTVTVEAVAETRTNTGEGQFC